MNSFHFTLSYSEVINIIRKLDQKSYVLSFNPTKKQYLLNKANSNDEYYLKLPILIDKLNPNFRKLGSSNIHFEQIPDYIILLIRAGHAALCTIQNDTITRHKVITKYMVRKKQGKAQLTYLATKGKARGGAKLRLAKSIEFFQEIRQKLSEWKEIIDKANIIFYHCSPRLWNGLYKTKSKVPMVFSQKDARLRRIPITTYKPTFKEMRRVKYMLSKGSLEIKSEEKITSIEDAFSNLLFSLQS